MLQRCITVPVFASTSSAKLLHGQGSQQHAEVVQRRLEMLSPSPAQCPLEVPEGLFWEPAVGISHSLAVLRPDRGTELQ